jgi:hypothetical protein
MTRTRSFRAGTRRSTPAADPSGFRNLLVAIDGPTGSRTLDLALSLLGAQRGTITLVGISPDVSMRTAHAASIGEPSDRVQRDLDAQISRELAAARDRIPAEIGVRTKLCRGRMGPSILAVAEQGHYDAIIVAAPPPRRFGTAFGTPSQYLRCRSRVPVILAPN